MPALKPRAFLIKSFVAGIQIIISAAHAAQQQNANIPNATNVYTLTLIGRPLELEVFFQTVIHNGDCRDEF